jgi:cation:H+ antiporter
MQTKSIIGLDRYDVISWIIVILFFLTSSLIFHGNTTNSLLGASGIIVLMLIISISITILLDIMKNYPKVGEIAGYITNGPEALCLIVGLVHSKIVFAVSVPLGSNFANSILLIFAGIIAGRFSKVISTEWKRTWSTILLTMMMAGGFFWKSSTLFRLEWVIVSLILSIVLYIIKPDEYNYGKEKDGVTSRYWMIPAILSLIAAGYFLDPLVSFTAKNSLVPEGLIGFVALSFMTSWPEFRSTLSLITMQKFRSAIIHIVVSNITNLWLAITGTIIYLVSQANF